jgi:hypothetical protein
VAERILSRDFPQPAGESVFVHNPAATARDPAFGPPSVLLDATVIRGVLGWPSALARHQQTPAS